MEWFWTQLKHNITGVGVLTEFLTEIRQVFDGIYRFWRSLWRKNGRSKKASSKCCFWPASQKFWRINFDGLIFRQKISDGIFWRTCTASGIFWRFFWRTHYPSKVHSNGFFDWWSYPSRNILGQLFDGLFPKVRQNFWRTCRSPSKFLTD